MITAALLPAPMLNIVASFLTKSFSLAYCDILILREESMTNTTSKRMSHGGSGSGVVVILMLGGLGKGGVVVAFGAAVDFVVFLGFVVAKVVVEGRVGGSLKTKSKQHRQNLLIQQIESKYATKYEAV